MTEQESEYDKDMRSWWMVGWNKGVVGGLTASMLDMDSSEYRAWKAGLHAGIASVKAAEEDSEMYVLPGIDYCLMWSRGVAV